MDYPNRSGQKEVSTLNVQDIFGVKFSAPMSEYFRWEKNKLIFKLISMEF